MRILYLTDTHLRGTTPRGRKDDLPAALAAKLREVVQLARHHGVKAILHGGDLFDRPDVATAVALGYLRILAGAPCPIYVVPGNHDLIGFNPETLPRTMLGLLDGAGVVRVLKPGEPAWLEEEGLKVQVTGQPFHGELDRRPPLLDYCLRPAGSGAPHQRDPAADFAVHLTHGMLLERPFLEEVPHTLLSAMMPETVADVTFGGHYHAGWSRVHSQDGRLFINPGALVRLGNQRADHERTVQVALLELEAGQAPACRLIPLEAALPADEILDRSRQEAQEARERALADFILGVGDLSHFEVLGVQEIMQQIARTQGIEPPVMDEALRRLGEAQAGLGEAEEEAVS